MLVGRPVHVPFMIAWYIIALDGCPILLWSHSTSLAVVRSRATLLATLSGMNWGLVVVVMDNADRSGSYQGLNVDVKELGVGVLRSAEQ